MGTSHIPQVNMGTVFNFTNTCSNILLAPFEYIKLRTQINTSPNDTTTFGLVDSVFRQEGFGGFFAGNTYRCLRFIPIEVLNRTFKARITRAVRKWIPKQYGLSRTVVPRIIADVLTLLFVYPLELWKTLACVAPEKCTNPRSLKGMYAGVSLRILELMVHRGVCSWGTWKIKLNSARTLVLYVSTSSVAALVVYPIETLCRRQMVQPELSVVDVFTQDTVASLWNGASVDVVHKLIRLCVLVGVEYLLKRFTPKKKKTKQKKRKTKHKTTKKYPQISKLKKIKLVNDDKDDDCPICMESLPNWWDCGRMVCCGKRMCMVCCRNMQSSQMSVEQKNRCIMCRSVYLIPGSQEEIEQMFHWVEKGKVWAIVDLGRSYLALPGTMGLKPNYKRAKELLELASKQGDACAQATLGIMYCSNKYGVAQDYKVARDFFEASAKQGHVRAQYNLGNIYQNGNGVTKSYEIAEKYLKAAAQQGFADAQYNLGTFYFFHDIGVAQNYDLAREYFEAAAKQGHINAQYNLGVMYHKGQGVAQNYERAREYFEPCAKQGKADAQNFLGTYYSHGHGVTKSHERAKEYFEAAAKQGHVNAQYNLGAMYCKGQGVAKNYERAKEYFEASAKQGYADAQHDLGVMYYTGKHVDIGVAKNYERAKEYLEAAAKQGHVNAQYNLGVMYCKGHGVAKNYERAKEYFEALAMQGHAEAQFNLSKLRESKRVPVSGGIV